MSADPTHEADVTDDWFGGETKICAICHGPVRYDGTRWVHRGAIGRAVGWYFDHSEVVFVALCAAFVLLALWKWD